MAEKKQFNPGEVICEEGRYERLMYIIDSGKVGVYAKYGTAEQKQLAQLGAGDVIGEMGLLESMPRSATVVALEPTNTLVITLDNFEEAFREREDVIFGIMMHMGERLTQLTDDYMEVCANIADYVEAEKAKSPDAAALLARIRTALSNVIYYY